MELANIDLGKLFVSKTNMRHADKSPDVSDILPTVKARGVIVPLIVRPGDDEGQPGMFGIVAGARRFHAATLAAQETGEAGPLPCAIMQPGDDAAALEASLIENIARLDPDEVAQWDTFTRLIQKEGRSVEQIGQTFGLTDLYVRRVLALGNLLPRIRHLYRDGGINVASIRHLTLATKAQQKAWLALFDSADDYCPTGQQLKSWLFGGASISTKHALFPLDSHKGKIVADLFGEDAVFADADQFWRAQNEAIAAKRDALLADGWAGVEIMEPGRYFHAWEHERTPKAKGGKVFVTVTHGGEVAIHEGYLSSKDAKKARGQESKTGATEADKQAARDQRSETTSSLQTYIDLHRHAAARAVLTDHPGVALRLMVAHAIAGSPLWNVRIETQHCRNESIAESVETGPAETRFDEQRRAALALLSFSPEEPSVAGRNGKDDDTATIFARLIGLADHDVLAILAVVMGETMQAGSAVVEAVGAYLAVDMGSLWTADDAFFDFVRDRQVANAMLREVAGKKVADANVAEKVKTQKAIIRDCLTGSNERKQVDGWVPKWLSFPAASYTARPFATLAKWKRIEGRFKNLPAPVAFTMGVFGSEPGDPYSIAAE
ncbi:MAG: chromosome partitioning protein ParB [Sphingomonas sp. 66-10]|uniref:ParB/RepB/Spo0J family partition protein n=1 Tax=Sphingomonas sp. 66-10 TaxID=1895848 RepID=UPI00086BB44D|nr:ParB N-terminal domain-containing protein [Sphingomonas sp. 66-10]ODU67914.1 MAG: chromosome partitioning protein ParB [Novosphingobium sp. SCN 66-18]OJU18217.1 MAG: chromosome partitioning protein ParB [Sphingomonas sp. 66-10]